MKTNKIRNHLISLKGNRNNSKISVDLYDSIRNIHLFLFMINKKEDTCFMMSTLNKKVSMCELYHPFISQLDYYYRHYIIIHNSEYIGKDYKEVIKQFNKK